MKNEIKCSLFRHENNVNVPVWLCQYSGSSPGMSATVTRLSLAAPHNLACTQMLITGKSVSQYASYSLIFNPSHSIINGEQHEKHLEI